MKIHNENVCQIMYQVGHKYSLVVGFHSPNVGGTVDEPSEVHGEDVPLHRGNVPAVGERVSVQEPGDKCGKKEAEERHQVEEVSAKGVFQLGIKI